MRGRATVRQNDFAFGEISADHAASGDAEAVSRSLRRARNIRLLNSFAFTQRFGSKRLQKLTSQVVMTTLVVSDGSQYIAALREAGLDIYDAAGEMVQSVEDAPWTLVQAQEATHATRVDSFYVAHQDFVTQVLAYDGTTWTLADFAFADGPGNTLLQPYYRYAKPGVTMQPSGLTGSITLTFSADVLEEGHEGVIFRYAVANSRGQEVRIDTVTDGSHASAMVLNDLPPTVSVEVQDASGFLIGEEVRGLDSNATGFVVGISGTTVTVTMVQGFEGFDDSNINDSDGNDVLDIGEYLVGEFTRSYIVTGSKTVVSPAALAFWDEAVVSPVHGYPGAVFERSGRLGLSRFPDLPTAVALSSPDAQSSFSVGTGSAADAIFVLLGQEDGQQIVHCVSAANLLILTTRGAYYVPEGPDSPLAPATFGALKIGPAGANGARPAVVDEGVVYVERGGNRIIALLSTGSLTAPWKQVDVSRQAPAEFFSGPVSITAVNGSTQAKERYVMVQNANGTIAVLFFDEAPARLGWVLWDTNGAWASSTAIDGFLYTCCVRTIAGVTTAFLERFDAEVQMDCSLTFADASALTTMVTCGGEEMVTCGGEQMLTCAPGLLIDLAGETVSVNDGTAYLGLVTVNEDGSINGTDIVSTFEAGYHFDMEAVLWPPEPEGDQRPNFARRHIGRVAVRVEDSQTFQFGLYGQNLPVTVPVYLETDDVGEPPPLRSDAFRRSFAGWLEEPSIQILRPIPQPVTVLSVAQEVAF